MLREYSHKRLMENLGKVLEEKFGKEKVIVNGKVAGQPIDFILLNNQYKVIGVVECIHTQQLSHAINKLKLFSKETTKIIYRYKDKRRRKLKKVLSRLYGYNIKLEEINLDNVNDKIKNVRKNLPGKE